MYRGLYQKSKTTIVRFILLRHVIASAPEAHEAIPLFTRYYEIASSLILHSSQ